MEPEKITFGGEVNPYDTETVIEETQPEQVEAPTEEQEPIQPETKSEPVVAPEKPAEQPAPPEKPAPVEQPRPGSPQSQAEEDFLEKAGIPKDDAFGRKMIQAYLSGDYQKFAQLNNTDWNQVPHLEVMRRHFQEQYAPLAADKRDKMVARELKKYDTENFDPEEKEFAEIQLELDANKVRDAFKAQQAQYVPPQPQLPPEIADVVQQMAQLPQAKADLEAKVTADPQYQQFETSRLVKIGEGDDAFSYEAPAEIDIKEAVVDGYAHIFFLKDKDGNDVKGKDGKPVLDVKRVIAARVFAQDPEGYVQKLAEHYIAIGFQRRDAEIRNPGTKITTTASEKAGITWGGMVTD